MKVFFKPVCLTSECDGTMTLCATEEKFVECDKCGGYYGKPIVDRVIPWHMPEDTE